jgi:hypothetical protein
MHITTNKIDIGEYEGIFKSIYAKHSEYWLRNQKEHSSPFKVIFDLGNYRRNNNIPRETFFEHVTQITQNTSAFSFTLTHALNLEDPVAGYCVHLRPDKIATTALRELYDKLWNEKWGEYLYQESDFFVDAAPLRWIRWEKEAISIVNDINQTEFEISGWINQIVISDIVNKSRVAIQNFNLRSS